MRQLYLPFIVALILTACQPSTATDTVESLTSNRERLKEVERACKTDRTKMGDALCNAASEARRRRFMGDGKVNTPSISTPSK